MSAFAKQQKSDRDGLFTLPSLMACPGQQLSVFMLSHFLTTFLDDAAQRITSLNQLVLKIKSDVYHFLKFSVQFFLSSLCLKLKIYYLSFVINKL
jgi:hypothetical protein